MVNLSFLLFFSIILVTFAQKGVAPVSKEQLLSARYPSTPWYAVVASRDADDLEDPPGEPGKTRAAAYIIWYFLGLFGGHRFYMKRYGTACVQLLLSMSLIGLPASLLWWIRDAFYVHQWVSAFNEERRRQYQSRLFYVEQPTFFVH